MVCVRGQLTAAERRIVELEACECRRQCPGPTPDGAQWYRDGDVVSQPDTCTQCVCRVRITFIYLFIYYVNRTKIHEK